jgi:hypothetical protein
VKLNISSRIMIDLGGAMDHFGHSLNKCHYNYMKLKYKYPIVSRHKEGRFHSYTIDEKRHDRLDVIRALCFRIAQ